MITSKYPRKIVNDFYQVIEQANMLYSQSEMLWDDLRKRINRTRTVEPKIFVERYY